MKKECLASGTLSSASFRRRFIKKSRVAPGGPQDVEGDCQLCRCSIFSVSGRSRTVRRIVTACVLSFLALLCSVSIDLSSNFDLLHTTEAAYDELTSCRTTAVLQLVSKLQEMRRLLVKKNESLEGSSPEAVFGQRLLDLWGTVEESVDKAKQNPHWREVLSARVLVRFKELNLRLMDSPKEGTHADFREKWSYILGYVSFARVLTGRLNDCWLENIQLRLNSSKGGEPMDVFDTRLWQISGADSEFLSGSLTGAEALQNTQCCFLDGTVQALRLASRSMSSVLSMRVCLLALACLIYPVVMFSFKQMTEWIQNYAQTLKEKTEDLKWQRQLAEDLLHQMLPKSVARQLRQRKHVEAESYDKVTIFFSDIVGFTSISASCTPLQVVEMLNNLYMCFDTRIDSYDVYKVETIGDAYMVVSGLPERNGDRHADEIAKMALDLVAAVRQVSIPHMQNQRLQLRAGIHTGPCVAGIVGYKMPRYCLFGDTVNTASRMESTSLPQKIHASSETYLALIKDNAYELQLRGEIEVKGKGKMKTYWLVGHKNYSVQNDSLVCHWNPNMAKKMKTPASSTISVGNSSVTVQSLNENTTTPVSIPPSTSNQTPPQPRTDKPEVSMSAQMEPTSGHE
ncbi:uncharacterized protein LOC141798986 [Halichoeres trimaculatus]|uniref:uncharacterized protein LOC141798986 n=1 Tax=Halichoeres trimaculatus TaxID=147232 RepID=UPI003D9EA482